MKLIIVSGAEATGKSFIGRYIAKLLDCQYIGKDMIKEALFDAESHSTWDYSWYEKKAKTVFFDTIKDFIQRDKTVVIESNFIGSDRERLISLLNEKVSVAEVYCTTRRFTSSTRFIKRNESGNRHKGHHDRRWYLKILLQDLLQYLHVNWPYKPVSANKKLLIIDNTHFSEANTKKVADFIN